MRMRRKYLGSHFDDWAAMRMRGKHTQAKYTNSHDTLAHFLFSELVTPASNWLGARLLVAVYRCLLSPALAS